MQLRSLIIKEAIKSHMNSGKDFFLPNVRESGYLLFLKLLDYSNFWSTLFSKSVPNFFSAPFVILERDMKTISSQLKIQCLNEPIIQGFSNWNVCFHYLFCSSIRILCRRPTRHAVVVNFAIIFGSDDLEKGIVFKCSSERDWK